MQLISVTILTGFLGAGKTTLLKRLLSENHGQKIAVIENEFGEVNIDNEILISNNDEQIIQMSNGCICCTIREDLQSALISLAKKKYVGELVFDRVIIETTGMADPGPIAQTFFMDEDIVENYVLDSIITLVDAKHGQQQLNDRQEVRKQIGFADQIFISKSDLVVSDELKALTLRLKGMNPRTYIDNVNFGNVSLSKVLDVKGFNLNSKLNLDLDISTDHGDMQANCHQDGGCDHVEGHHHHYNDDVKSFIYKSEKPFDSVKLENFISAFVQIHGANMLRYKGVLYMKGTDRKVIFQGVHQIMGSDLGPAWKNGESKQSKIVFIGIDLPKSQIEEGLNQALS